MPKSVNSLAIHWLELHALTAWGLDSIPDQETKTPQFGTETQFLLKSHFSQN